VLKAVEEGKLKPTNAEGIVALRKSIPRVTIVLIALL
jgi:hypothetical protein